MGPPRFAGLLSVKELAARFGYEATDIEVLTEDGYSLWLHRIGNNSGPPVLMHHGLFMAADFLITRGPKKDLTYILVEEGFDVWLSNGRGTAYNEYCLNYSRSDPRYWDFSFHESGYYDIPAIVDTILEKRRVRQLYYIGASLGATVFLVMASTRPDYNSKIRAAVLLSPLAIVPPRSEVTPFYQWLLRSIRFICNLQQQLGQQEIGIRTNTSIRLLSTLCTRCSICRYVGMSSISLLVGENKANINKEDWDFYVPYFFAGNSSNTLYHFTQLYISGEFRQFDYGKEENLIKYKSPKPPVYHLDAVTTPVAIYWGRNDPLLSESAVNKLASRLPNLIVLKAAPDPKYNHADPLLGDNAAKILYPDIVDVLKSFSNRK